MSPTDRRARALPLRRWSLMGLPLLLALPLAAGADPAPMSSAAAAICGCADHDPACIDEAWPAGSPLLDQLDACADDGEGACAAEALLDLAELDPPACLPAGYAMRVTPTGGGALPTGRAIGLVVWSWGRVPFDLSICTEANRRNLTPTELQQCLRAGLIGDTEDGGRFENGEPDGDEGWSGGGEPEHGGGDTGG
jgi:hypothetical protein